MTRGLVIDTVTGVIKRKVTAPPGMLAVQVGVGESLFALVDDDGGFINDAYLILDEAGEWALVEGAPQGVTVPVATPHYVAI